MKDWVNPILLLLLLFYYSPPLSSLLVGLPSPTALPLVGPYGCLKNFFPVWEAPLQGKTAPRILPLPKDSVPFLPPFLPPPTPLPSLFPYGRQEMYGNGRRRGYGRERREATGSPGSLLEGSLLAISWKGRL